MQNPLVLAITNVLLLLSSIHACPNDGSLPFSNCGSQVNCFDASTLVGTIQNAYYPLSYSNNMNCTYSVEEKPGWSIQIHLWDLDTEAGADYLTINHYPPANSAENLAMQVGKQ